jgi:hypothetical protein
MNDVTPPEAVAFELDMDATTVGTAIADAIDSTAWKTTSVVVGFTVWLRHPETGHAVAETRSTIPPDIFYDIVGEWYAHATAHRS